MNKARCLPLHVRVPLIAACAALLAILCGAMAMASEDDTGPPEWLIPLGPDGAQIENTTSFRDGVRTEEEIEPAGQDDASGSGRGLGPGFGTGIGTGAGMVNNTLDNTVSTQGSPDDLKAAAISAFIKSRGGSQAIRHAWSSQRTDRLYAGDRSGTSTTYFVRPLRMREDSRFGSDLETLLLNGNNCISTGSGLVPLHCDDWQHVHMLYRARAHDLAFGLLTGLYEISHEGMGFIGGHMSDALLLTDREGIGPILYVFIERDTGNLIKSTAAFTIGGEEHSFTTLYKDYRDVGGAMLPFRMNVYRDGRLLRRLHVIGYETNPLMSPSIFER